MITAILSAIMGGVAASALPPRTSGNTFLPLIVVLVVAAVLGGV